MRGQCQAITQVALTSKDQRAEPELLAGGTPLDITCADDARPTMKVQHPL